MIPKYILSLLVALSLTTFEASACSDGHNDIQPNVSFNEEVYIGDPFKDLIRQSKNISIRINDIKNYKRICTFSDNDIIFFKYGIYVDDKRLFLSNDHETISLMMSEVLKIKDLEEKKKEK